MTWRGPWNSGTSYAIDDLVEYNGSTYIAIATSLNQAPFYPGSPYWDLVALRGASGPSGPVGNTGPSGPSGPS